MELVQNMANLSPQRHFNTDPPPHSLALTSTLWGQTFALSVLAGCLFGNCPGTYTEWSMGYLDKSPLWPHSCGCLGR